MSDIEGEWPLRLGDLDPPPKSVLLAWVEFDGEVHGALLALDKRTGEFVEDDAQVLEALAKGVAEAVENIRLYQNLQVRS